MVVATREGVQGFTLDPADGIFRRTNPDIRIPQNNSCYSTNEGNFKGMDRGTQKAVEELRNTYSLRYAGSLALTAGCSISSRRMIVLQETLHQFKTHFTHSTGLIPITNGLKTGEVG